MWLTCFKFNANISLIENKLLETIPCAFPRTQIFHWLVENKSLLSISKYETGVLSTGSLFTRGRTTDKDMGRKMRRNRNVLKSWEWSMSLFHQLERNTALGVQQHGQVWTWTVAPFWFCSACYILLYFFVICDLQIHLILLLVLEYGILWN